mmetsp:Transcript_9299/g.18484  ORF Transcript_9299/g.18484 Transcript_9299/m.18484 type:complete len:213 (+) Transcript_9299:172-810(+)|eukprot:jgi/Picre1/27808/NNA_000772.t1
MESQKKPECYLILFNVSKKHNIGTILRCATAFDVTTVCLVGSRNFNTFGSHGSDAYVHLRHFETLEECCRTLKEDHGCTIVGIEIDDEAKAIQTHPFSGNTAFMLGNEGQGMNEKQMKLCDSFVYIPQYGVGTASLNVAVATSIVLHHFALWAGYTERSRTQHKYDVADRPQRTAPRGYVPYTEEELSALRAQRRLKKDEAAASQQDGAKEK